MIISEHATQRHPCNIQIIVVFDGSLLRFTSINNIYIDINEYITVYLKLSWYNR